MLKIAIYKDVLKSGRGADRATAALLNALSKRGYKLHLITQHQPNEAFSVTLDAAIQHHSIPRPISGFKGFINKFLLKSTIGEKLLRKFFPKCDQVLQTNNHLRRLLESIKPDLILSSGVNETIDLCANEELPAPLIQLFHIFPLESFKKNKLQKATRFKRALKSHVKACQVLLPSHKAILQPYTSAPIEVIGNAIHMPNTQSIPPMSKRNKELVYIAYFSKDKNQTQLIEAFAKAKEASQWRLKLYGTGSKEWTARLKDCAKQYGVSDRIDFMGLTTTPYEVLSNAMICAYPSLTEGFGMALAEAMWCGCACIGFRTASGVNELLNHSVTGELVDPTVESLALAIDDLILHPEKCQTLGHVAAQFVRNTYAPDVIWGQWETLFSKLHTTP
jgi:glycosyltransferase involved in cell wall biosynthesis